MSEMKPVPPSPPIIISRVSEKATMSLVFGMVSYLFVPFVAGIVAIILGEKAEKEIRQSGGQLTGLGMAKAGQILGWINVLVTGLLGCMLVSVFIRVFSSS
jgi:hypothetical protein